MHEELMHDLERLRCLYSGCQTEESDEYTDETLAAYQQLRNKIRDEWLPVIDAMCRAGLLHVHIEDSDHKFAGMDLVRAYVNGGIYLIAGEVHMSGRDGCPTIKWSNEE